MAKQEESIILNDFKQFCRERHAEDKGRNYNLLQEIYSQAELFDMSMLGVDLENYKDLNVTYDYTSNVATTKVDFLKNYALPFPVMFLKVGTDSKSSVFLREYEYTIITGTIYTIVPKATINTPFTIYTDTGKVILDAKGFYQLSKKYNRSVEEKEYREMVKGYFAILLGYLKALTELPKHTVVADVVERATYYPRKKASTLKVVRPIYYVLNKSEETKPNKIRTIRACGELHYDHSFKVRSHWRKLHNPSSLGKDRTGEYTVKGLTFVKSYLKGSGELQKRIRILK